MFKINQEYVQNFEIHVVGGQIHQELWVPAEELEEFNRHIIGKIEIIAAYYGDEFDLPINPKTNLPIDLDC